MLHPGRGCLERGLCEWPRLESGGQLSASPLGTGGLCGGSTFVLLKNARRWPDEIGSERRGKKKPLQS